MLGTALQCCSTLDYSSRPHKCFIFSLVSACLLCHLLFRKFCSTRSFHNLSLFILCWYNIHYLCRRKNKVKISRCLPKGIARFTGVGVGLDKWSMLVLLFPFPFFFFLFAHLCRCLQTQWLARRWLSLTKCFSKVLSFGACLPLEIYTLPLHAVCCVFCSEGCTYHLHAVLWIGATCNHALHCFVQQR